jgi:hypothetical protein
MINYAKEELIDQPVSQGAGKGAHAYYPKDTLEKIHAIHTLMWLEQIPPSKMRWVVKVGTYLEGKIYKSYSDVVGDEDLRDMIDGYPRLAFYTAEYLRLKNGAKRMFAPDAPGALIGANLEILKDKQAVYSFVEGATAEPIDIPYVSQGLLVMIANQENEILSNLK